MNVYVLDTCIPNVEIIKESWRAYAVPKTLGFCHQKYTIECSMLI